LLFYLHLRNDENVVAFNQLSQTVRDVLEAIGYKEICRHFTPAPPPVSISLVEIAYCAGAGYELAFFGLLEKRIDALIEAGADKPSPFVAATLCEASPRHENMDASLRRIARGNCLFRSRKTGVRYLIGHGLIVRCANETPGLMTIFEKIIERQFRPKSSGR